MRSNRNRRKFYIITAIVLVAIIGTAVFITAYIELSYVKIDVAGNSSTSFAISYDSANATLPSSESATVEVLPHVDVTITAIVTPPSTIVRWDVNGATFTQTGQDTITFVTGGGGSTIQISVELTNSSS